MITYDLGDIRFNYRVVGAAFDGDRVLLHRAVWDDFWALPGGRAELLEPSAEVLKREMLEELGVPVGVERLLWVVENFFEHGGFRYHELSLYFLMTLSRDTPLRRASGPFFGMEDNGTRLEFRWFPLEELASVDLRPSFLSRALRQLPASPTHVVQVE
jgi:ADP-ribose pyrophosphatase YjhB (NUDIX family)